MKILYDMTYTQGSKFFSGLYEYGKKNLENKINDVDVLVLKDYSLDEYVKDNAKLVYIDAKKDSNDFYKKLYKLSFNYNIIYFPYQLTTHKVKLAKTCKMYFTIHDLAQLDLSLLNKSNKFEKYYLSGFKSRFKYMCKSFLRLTHIWHHKLYKCLSYNINKASKIIAVSNSTKKDILAKFNTLEEKIYVCYSPLKFSNGPEGSNLTLKNYFLFVSASRYTKNAINAIKAFDLYKDDTQKDVKLVITGNLPDKIVDMSKYSGSIINLSYVSNNDLEYLYKNANCLIFSSFYEGFGMPPLEAMKYGTKVVCSNLPCLTELYEHALFFDPYNPRQIKATLLNLHRIHTEDMLRDYENLKDKCEEALILHKDIILK